MRQCHTSQDDMIELYIYGIEEVYNYMRKYFSEILQCHSVLYYSILG